MGRLAAANSCQSLGVLRSLYGRSQGRCRRSWKLGFSPNDVAAMAGGNSKDLFRQGLQRLDTRWVSLHGMVFDRKLLAISSRRLCPQCLAQHGISDWTWAFRLVTVCVQHGCGLVDTCDQCGALLFWESGFVGCWCGRRFAEIPAPPAGQIELGVADTVCSALSHAPSSRVAKQLTDLDEQSWRLHGYMFASNKTLSRDRPRVVTLGGARGRDRGIPGQDGLATESEVVKCS